MTQKRKNTVKSVLLMLLVLLLLTAVTALVACAQKCKTFGHNWQAGQVTSEATCLAKGKQIYECSVCHKQEIRDIDFASHVYGELHTSAEASCAENGTVAYYQCLVCKQYFDEDFNLIGDNVDELEISPTSVHSWEAGKVTSEATCLTRGKQIYECSVCHEQELRDVDFADHIYGELHTAVDPTCGADGNVDYYQCSVCKQYFDVNKSRIESVIRYATGNHSWGVADGNASWVWPDAYEKLLENGVKVNLQCTTCGATQQRNAEFIKDDESSREPTYTQEGSYVFSAWITLDDITLNCPEYKAYTLPKLPDNKPDEDYALVGDFDGGSWQDTSLLMSWNPDKQVYEIEQSFAAYQSWAIAACSSGELFGGNAIVSVAFKDGLEQPSEDLYTVADRGIKMLFSCTVHITFNATTHEIGIFVEELDLNSQFAECWLVSGTSGSAEESNVYNFTREEDGTYTLIAEISAETTGLSFRIFYNGESISYSSLTKDFQRLENGASFTVSTANGYIRATMACKVKITYNPSTNTLKIASADE